MENIIFEEKYLNNLYNKFNNKKYIHPDPLEFLYNYTDKKDIELVGFIASSLAYGKVCQILKSVKIILNKLGPYPYESILNINNFSKLFSGFKHRFTKDYELIAFLEAIKKVLIEHKTFENLFIKSILKTYETRNIEEFNALIKNNFKVIQSNYNTLLSNFTGSFKLGKSSLLPNPEKHSACKRLNLYLKWMIRKDNIDTGIWSNISPEILIIPLDTHIYKFAKKNKLTHRNTADFKTALEITNSFRKIAPLDPSKYDFAITRFGIRDDLKN